MNLQELIAALTLPFVLRALLAMLVLAAAASVISVLVNFRRMEFVTDGLVHAIFPGLVIGYLVGGSAALLPGAIVAALVAVGIITLLLQRGRFSNDAAVAVTLGCAFSLGIVLVSREHGYMAQLQSLLFGHLLTVTWEQLVTLSLVAGVALLLVLTTWRAQLFRAHDARGFAAAGFSPLRTDLILGVAIALLIVAGVQALGNLLVIALLIVPAAAARQLTDKLCLLIPLAFGLVLVASVIGIGVSVWGGIAWSVHISAGAAVVLLLLAGYGLALLSGVVRAGLRRGQARAGQARAGQTPVGQAPAGSPGAGKK